ncbi:MULTISPECIES: RagB/SusD family nutrient uptake outer membrane protein [Butyricimonas]|uniref:RagB/SusD family nutrient uptake outer membrane protein n=1 Tax=Butyricimonas TaxID=574697 RepID=UPI001D06B6BA|nr:MULTISPECIES: RagB/SusD family nutrient uptake outer membrane protein [Butyricimonas]MCB6974285.1 RagB/SusD family nutrient uptake outer membrane protein [Butyricimonas synergistica]MCG4521155.1 RagB/SusD family nutrient uptake outer membrane protein [Butyricimonas sp. DFI.6.44]
MKKILYLIVFLAFGWSCSDFLEEDAQNLTYVNSINDLDQLLIGEGYAIASFDECSNWNGSVPAWMHLLDDDLQYCSAGMLGNGDNQSCSAIYGWQREPWKGGLTDDDRGSTENKAWSELYQYINALNVMLYEAKEFKNEPDYNRIKGEAMFLRATYYWWLVNIYSKAYDVKTADKDPGVPLKLTPYVEDYEEEGGFSRASVAEVYGQIVADLKDAVQLLSGYGRKSVYRASMEAARLFLSRVYLHMENYEGVINECDTLLQNNVYRLDDYTLIESASQSLITSHSPEVIFSQGGYRLRYFLGSGSIRGAEITWEGGGLQLLNPFYGISDDLKDAFNDNRLVPDQSQDNDFRYKVGMAYVELTDWSSMLPVTMQYLLPAKLKKWDDGGVSDVFTLRLAEVYLNKAEALAAVGREEEANQLWQELRRYRIAEPEAVALHGENLMTAIRAERRLEFNFEGFRWLDLRRYAVNSKYPQKKEITHIWLWGGKAELGISAGEETYVLAPYGEDPAWVFPIPAEEHRLNSRLELNEEREERKAVK